MVVGPLPDLGSLSDIRLARLLTETATELQRRKASKADFPSQAEFEQALRGAARVLEVMMPKRTGKGGRSRTADAAPPLREGKRKAIRTALQAGVAPGQVAKHFGLSLSAVRKVLTDET
jgi:hypothetical protein